MTKEYNVIGLMSGTSLDGLDIAHCTFVFNNEKWSYKINAATTLPYPAEWKHRLTVIMKTDAVELAQANVDYGHYLGQKVANFLNEHKLKADFISSHGHTVFHQPQRKLTLQIGDGAAIAAETNLPVVCDFRSTDVALGGQGAPLVPIGDRLLFSEFDYCLNLGGIANISYENKGKRIAFDICPVNIILNALVQPLGKAYDDGGTMARQGMLHPELLEELNGLAFYKEQGPKSIGREWIDEEVFPILNKYGIPIASKLHTFCEHIAIQIGKYTQSGKMLISGGGAHNTYLVEQIKAHSQAETHIAEPAITNFKEALIFAFLGVLRMRNEVNCLASVTGASRDSVGGGIYLTR